jgi:molybdenum cofactor biosynthesis enzyme MoaA
MKRHDVHILEMMIISTCQINCEECDRFSNFDLAWHQNLEDYEKSCAVWSKRLNPTSLTIIGGEPLIHPDIYDILRISRRYFKEAVIELYTNGFLLDKKVY